MQKSDLAYQNSQYQLPQLSLEPNPIKTRIANIFCQKLQHPPTQNSTLINMSQNIDISGYSSVVLKQNIIVLDRAVWKEC